MKTNFTNRFATLTTRRFEGGYYVDIQIDQKPKDNQHINCYLWNENNGIKMLMFGIPMNKTKEEYWRWVKYCKENHKWNELDQSRNVIPYVVNEVIKPNLKEYIKTYKELYENEE